MKEDKHSTVEPNDLDHHSTRVISHSFEYGGVTFSWWAVDESPSLVTVSSRWFGAKADFTSDNVEEFAKELAGKILAEHEQTAARKRAAADGDGME